VAVAWWAQRFASAFPGGREKPAKGWKMDAKEALEARILSLASQLEEVLGLKVGDNMSFLDLMQCADDSGNEAAIAIAEQIRAAAIDFRAVLRRT
jgi:D-alanyl-D-alanine carboxypeptidase